MPLTPGQERFARTVAEGTGLEVPTVRAWVLAESGPDDNPLNIMADARARRIARFGNPDAAAEATIALLRTDRYRTVLVAADSINPRRELAAIAASPWEERQYRGNTGTVGGLLTATYNALYPTGRAQPIVDLTPGFDLPGLPDLNPFDNIAGWLKEDLPVYTLYAILTVFALWLVVMGLMRALGLQPLQALGLRRSRAAEGSAQSEEIPF